MAAIWEYRGFACVRLPRRHIGYSDTQSPPVEGRVGAAKPETCRADDALSAQRYGGKFGLRHCSVSIRRYECAMAPPSSATTAPNPSNNARAILIACGGIGLFSLMDAAMKHVSLEMTPYNALLWRSVLGVPISGVAMLVTRAGWPARSTWPLQFQRAVVTTAMAWLFFLGVTMLPLAESIALSFIAPLIALYLASLVLGEQIGRSAIAASLFGLVGVAVILSGQLGAQQHKENALLGACAVLGSAVLYAYCLILQRRLAQVAPPASLAMMQSLFMSLMLGLLSPWLGRMPAADMWPMVITASALAVAAILALSRAYSMAQAQVLIPIEYTAFLWAAACGWVFFREPLGITTLIGAAIIIAACLVASRTKPDLSAKEEAFV